MKEKIVKLIDLKTIITILLTIALIVGFFMDKISAEVFVPFISMTFTFYFTKKTSTSDTTEVVEESTEG